MTLPNDPQMPAANPPTATRRRSRGPLIGGLTALLLLAAWGGGTIYAAGQAQTVSNDLATRIDASLKANKLGSVEKHTYARGLTESTDDLYLKINDTTPLRLHLRNHIKNGPLPGLSSVGQAVIDSELIWDDPKVQAAVDKAFAGKKPSVHTVVGLGGSTDTTISVPAGSYVQETKGSSTGGTAGGTATWQALTGQFRTTSGGRGVVGELAWPGTVIASTQASEGKVELKDLKYQVDQQPYLNNLSQGTSSFTVASVALPTGVGALSGLNITTTTAAAPGGQTLESRTGTSIASLSAAGTSFKNVKLNLSATQLSSAALEDLSGVFRKPEYQKLTDEKTGKLNDALLQTLLQEATPMIQKLLAGNPKLAIDEVSVQMPQGRLKLALGAQIVDGGSIDLKTLLSKESVAAGAKSPALLGLIGNLKLSADIEGNQSVIEALLGSSGNATAAGIGGSIEPMIKQGMITKTGDLLRTRLEFSKAGAMINGKPAPMQ